VSLDPKKAIVACVCVLISWLVFDNYHAGAGMNFMRIKSMNKTEVVFIGEVLPACILAAGSIYVMRKDD
jgi:hypothetical protein